MNELLKTLELLNKRLDNFEGELKKVKENKQPDDQSKHKVQVTMRIIIEVHIEVDLIYIKDMK